MRFALTALGTLAAAALAPATAGALTLEPVGTFTAPVYVTSDPADEDRLLVVEQAGMVKLRVGQTTTDFLDLTSLVVSGGERGLFSIALAPDYPATGHLYALYTRAGPGADLGDLQLDEFTAAGNGASASTRRPVLTIHHETYANHNGGQLQFGPDGYLYVATGDGGSSNDPFESGQDTGSLLGKILRIDPRQSGGSPYTVPSSNPFYGATPGADEVWSYGLRNPWRFSFDRVGGGLAIGDVGQAAWEEIDYDPGPNAGRGDNFGWDCREGRHDFELTGCAGATFTEPILEYQNPALGPASVTGGYVVRDASLGDLYGRYLYADVYAGQIRSLVPGVPNAGSDRAEGLPIVSAPVSFGEDRCARVYVVSQGTGVVSRLTGIAPADCTTPPPLPPAVPPPNASCAGEKATEAASAPGRINGTSADDSIIATDKDDVVRGRRGDDALCGRAGADVLRGGRGDDVLRGGPGRDRCHGGGGRDKLRSCSVSPRAR